MTGEPRLLSRRGLVLPALLLAGWFAATDIFRVSPLVLPSPRAVIAAALAPDIRLTLASVLGASLLRVLAGYLAGAACGICFGALIALSRPAGRVLAPWFHVSRQIAIFAWIPLVTAWLGGGDLAKIAFVALSSFYVVAINTERGIGSVPRGYLELASVLRLSRVRTLTRVVLPAARPAVVNGLTLAVIYAWLGTIGAEYLMSAAPGIGSFVMEARSEYRPDLVFASVALIAGCGIAMSAGLSRAASRLLGHATS